MCNAILFWNFGGHINGSLMNAFEYYIAILEHNPDIHLYMLDCSDLLLEQIKSVYRNRYVLDDLDWEKNIVNLETKGQLIKQKFDKVLVLDFCTINIIRGLFNSEKVVVIQELHTWDKDYQFSKKLYDVTYYGEMPFVYKDHEYRMKMLFHRFRPIRKADKAIFLNNQRGGTLRFLKKIQLPDKPIIMKTPNHRTNLFELYDTYVYYHSGTWFDPHPRLFHESYFYGKDIIYFNPGHDIDGSWYRFYDVRENGLKDRFFSKEDKIIQEFI